MNSTGTSESSSPDSRYFDHRFLLVGQRGTAGWAVDDDGSPNAWWRARLDSAGVPVRLSDGTDLRKSVATVTIRVGTEAHGKTPYTGPRSPGPKRGYLACAAPDDEFKVGLFVQSQTISRVIDSLRSGIVLTTDAAFGPDDSFVKLTGPITRNSEDGYRWDNATASVVPIEECSFTFTFPGGSDAEEEQEEEEEGTSDETPHPIVRKFGITWALFRTLFALGVTFGCFGAARTAFETVIVALLVLIYVAVATSRIGLAQFLARTEVVALARFLQLRTLAGFPTRQSESRALQQHQAAIDSPSAAIVIDYVGISIIGLIALFNLGSSLL